MISAHVLSKVRHKLKTYVTVSLERALAHASKEYNGKAQTARRKSDTFIHRTRERLSKMLCLSGI